MLIISVWRRMFMAHMLVICMLVMGDASDKAPATA